MEHSVQAYLRRLPTETLEKFLQDYKSNRHSEDFSEMIGSVLRELERREIQHSSPNETLPRWW